MHLPQVFKTISIRIPSLLLRSPMVASLFYIYKALATYRKKTFKKQVEKRAKGKVLFQKFLPLPPGAPDHSSLERWGNEGRKHTLRQILVYKVTQLHRKQWLLLKSNIAFWPLQRHRSSFCQLVRTVSCHFQSRRCPSCSLLVRQSILTNTVLERVPLAYLSSVTIHHWRK